MTRLKHHHLELLKHKHCVETKRLKWWNLLSACLSESTAINFDRPTRRANSVLTEMWETPAQGLRCCTRRKTRLKRAALCEAQGPLGQRWERKSLTLLFLLPAAGLNVVYVIFFDRFLQLLEFCSLIILFKVFIDIVRHLQVLCFSAYNVAYGPVKTSWRKQFSSSNIKKWRVFSPRYRFQRTGFSTPPLQLLSAGLQLPQPPNREITSLGQSKLHVTNTIHSAPLRASKTTAKIPNTWTHLQRTDSELTRFLPNTVCSHSSVQTLPNHENKFYLWTEAPFAFLWFCW